MENDKDVIKKLRSALRMFDEAYITLQSQYMELQRSFPDPTSQSPEETEYWRKVGG